MLVIADGRRGVIIESADPYQLCLSLKILSLCVGGGKIKVVVSAGSLFCPHGAW